MSWNEGKKIKIIKESKNKKFAGEVIGIDSKNIYKASKKEVEDLSVKETIENTFKTHPAYGHRRLSIELKMNRKKIRRIMKKYGLKPPRLWYQKKFITEANHQYEGEFNNLIKDVKNPDINEIWSSDLTYVKYKDQFIYVSAIKDIASREEDSFYLQSLYFLPTLSSLTLLTKMVFHSKLIYSNISITKLWVGKLLRYLKHFLMKQG